MSSCIFSVMVGQITQQTDVRAYVQQLNRMERGIHELLAPLKANAHTRLFKRIDSNGEEWLDVHVVETAQRSMISDFERSIGSSLKEIDIAANIAQQRSQIPPTALAELLSRQHWNLTEFVDLIERETLIRAGRRMCNDQGTLIVRMPDGQRTAAQVPNRRFSALCPESVELQFRPLMVGRDTAHVLLNRDSTHLIRSRSRRIHLTWQGESNTDVSDVLFSAVKAQRWARALCGIVTNRDGKAKSLLMFAAPNLI